MQWNRLYRPEKIEDLCLDDVRKQLTTLLQSPSFPQVILCAGPKGTGKTTTARILAALVNDPHNAPVVEQKIAGAKPKKNLSDPSPDAEIVQRIFAGSALNVQELDAASNRGIDDVRRLQDTIYLNPQEGSMQVVILDEAHMLTNEAFNALLKLLEEPPQHALFILATTEIHKIPATVLSRALVIEFRKAQEQELLAAAQRILQQENIQYTDEQLSMLAHIADGSFRDMVKLLQLHTTGDVLTTDELTNKQAISADYTQQLIAAIIEKDSAAACVLFENARKKAVSPKLFYSTFINVLHQHAVDAASKNTINSLTQPIAVFLLKTYLVELAQVNSPLAFVGMETITLELITRAQKKGGGSKQKKPQQQKTTENKKSMPELQASELTEATKHAFIDLLQAEHPSICVLIQSAKLSSAQENLVVEVYYSLHKDRLESSAVHRQLLGVVHTVFGSNWGISVRVAQKTPQASSQISEIAHKTLM